MRKKPLSPGIDDHPTPEYWCFWTPENQRFYLYHERDVFFLQTWTNCIFKQNLKGWRYKNHSIYQKKSSSSKETNRYPIRFTKVVLRFDTRLFNKVEFFIHCTQESICLVFIVLDSIQFIQANSSNKHHIYNEPTRYVHGFESGRKKSSNEMQSLLSGDSQELTQDR